jgi:hypothetical protein
MYTLSNVEEMNRKYPVTFHVAERTEREGVKVEDYVKLHFHYPSGNSERMWVKVLEILPGPRFKGTLDNDPFFEAEAPKCGESIEFGPENIATILDRPN